MKLRAKPETRRRILTVLGPVVTVLGVVVALLAGALTSGQDDPTGGTPGKNQASSQTYIFTLIREEEHRKLRLTVSGSSGYIDGQYILVAFSEESGKPGGLPRPGVRDRRHFTGRSSGNWFRFDGLDQDGPITGILNEGVLTVDRAFAATESKKWTQSSEKAFKQALTDYAEDHPLGTCPTDPEYVVCPE
ncbi:hypothetical protein [Actinomadura miaoliensis]|uniref:Uncharacterized protein n=1 Tax=Actinomadura miaoliensis TaxID=430685 RepID=A0ABP7WTT7_9ACTN